MDWSGTSSSSTFTYETVTQVDLESRQNVLIGGAVRECAEIPESGAVDAVAVYELNALWSGLIAAAGVAGDERGSAHRESDQQDDKPQKFLHNPSSRTENRSHCFLQKRTFVSALLPSLIPRGYKKRGRLPLPQPMRSLQRVQCVVNLPCAVIIS